MINPLAIIGRGIVVRRELFPFGYFVIMGIVENTIIIGDVRYVSVYLERRKCQTRGRTLRELLCNF